MKQPLAYIHPDAKIAPSVVIEPFVTIDKNVEIGEGTRIGPNVTILEGSRIGKNCTIFPGAVVGAIPQDLKFKGEYVKNLTVINWGSLQTSNCAPHVEYGNFVFVYRLAVQ